MKPMSKQQQQLAEAYLEAAILRVRCGDLAKLLIQERSKAPSVTIHITNGKGIGRVVPSNN